MVSLARALSPVPAPAATSAVPIQGGRAAVLQEVRREETRLRDGSRVSVGDDEVTIRDAEGRLCLRWVDGHVEINAPRGDVRFAAPAGRVVLEGAHGVELRSPGPIEVRAERLRLLGRRLDVVAGKMTQRVDHVAVTARRWELRATRLLEQTREATRETEDLLRVEAGRMATVARGLYQLVSRRTELTSEKDTSIDGERVLLG